MVGCARPDVRLAGMHVMVHGIFACCSSHTFIPVVIMHALLPALLTQAHLRGLRDADARAQARHTTSAV